MVDRAGSAKDCRDVHVDSYEIPKSKVELASKVIVDQSRQAQGDHARISAVSLPNSPSRSLRSQSAFDEISDDSNWISIPPLSDQILDTEVHPEHDRSRPYTDGYTSEEYR
jgi:hypothetical protein